MKILCIGDVTGNIGCEHLRKVLPSFKAREAIDVVICNGENSSDNNGISEMSVRFLLDSGVDMVTTGNHTYKNNCVYNFLDTSENIVRPANFPKGSPGVGMKYVDRGKYRVAVINILGTKHLEPLSCPFDAADELVKTAKNDGIKVIIIDFHAETTAEKRALGFHLDGKISALVGTHTHVQTADAQVLPQGTGYITDLGMCGPVQSVLGVDPNGSIKFLRSKMPVKFIHATGECMLNGAVLEVDEATGKCVNIRAVDIR